MDRVVPQSLRWNVSKLNGFARNRVKIPVLTPATANCGDQVIAEFSSGQKIDLSTLSFHYLMTTAATSGTTPSVLPPQYSQCMIQQLSIDVNGVNIFNCDYYNHLWHLLASWTAGDWAQAYGTVSGEWSRNNFAANASSCTLTNVPMVMKNFLGPFASGKILDTALCGPIRVTMRIAPTAALINYNGVGITAALSSMSFQFDVVVLDSSYDQAMQIRLSDGGVIPWAFTNYLAYLGPNSSLDLATNRVSANVSSLDYILHTVCPSTFLSAGNGLETAAGGVLINSTTAGTGTSSHFTKGESTKSLTSYQIQIGSTQCPTYRHANACEAMTMTGDALGKYLDLTASAGPFFSTAPISGAISGSSLQSAYQYGFFLAAARLCAGAAADMDYGTRLQSGLDTRGSNTLISCITYGTGGGNIFPLTYLQFTSVLNIAANRQLMLVM